MYQELVALFAVAIAASSLEWRPADAFPMNPTDVAQIGAREGEQTPRTPACWLVAAGAAVHGGDMSLPSSAEEWWGGSGRLSAGRVLNDAVTVALNIQVQQTDGHRTGFFKTRGGTPARTAGVGFITVAGSTRFRTARLGNVPVLALLSWIKSGYLRTDIGYTRAHRLDGVGRVEDEHSSPIVRTFEGGTNGLYALGGLGLEKRFGQRWGFGPEFAVEYHQFSDWYAVFATLGFSLTLRM
jgi:hypothetical protein